MLRATIETLERKKDKSLEDSRYTSPGTFYTMPGHCGQAVARSRQFFSSTSSGRQLIELELDKRARSEETSLGFTAVALDCRSKHQDHLHLLLMIKSAIDELLVPCLHVAFTSRINGTDPLNFLPRISSTRKKRTCVSHRAMRPRRLLRESREACPRTFVPFFRLPNQVEQV